MEATDWPGSQLGFGNTARLVSYRFDQEVVEVFLRYSNQLSDCGYPVMPDDPHWLRTDGTLVIRTTIHEDLAWLDVTPTEMEDVPAAIRRRT